MKKILIYVYGGIVMMGFILFFCVRSLPDGLLHIFMLDIGQGDSFLIETPKREYILIDGGPNNKVVQQLAEVMPFYEKTIDVLILTHPHADHVNGLNDVLNRYKVKQALITGVYNNYAGYKTFLNLLVEKNVEVIFARENDFKIGGVILDMLYPFYSLQGEEFENENNASIVFRLIFGKRKFYFSGDAEIEEEQKLIKSNLSLKADVYKVGHHGSRTSSSEDLLDLINPKYALISCGVDNKFKHPRPQTIENLQKRGIKIYRTDLDGSVEIVSDGNEIKLF